MWKKNLLEKNEFIETSSIKFGEMFFFPSFIRNKFFEYFNSMRKQQKSKNFGFLFGTNDI